MANVQVPVNLEIRKFAVAFKMKYVDESHKQL